MIKFEIGKDFYPWKDELLKLPLRFETEGEVLKANRNVIKKLKLENMVLNIKSFKIPHFINKIAYAYFRKSKARRSFEYAETLIRKGIPTPTPVAYIEKREGLGWMTSSYYISLQLDEPTFRDLRNNKPDDWESLLCAFTRFTYDFQQKGVYFLDHSPGNTLIRRTDEGKYEFYLVDLNRMKFKKLTLEEGLKNFSRLGISKEDAGIIADEYALLTGGDLHEMTNTLVKWVVEENERVEKKSALRKK